MKKITSAIAAFLASFGLLFAVPTIASATTACSIPGAVQATWGCGSVTSFGYDGFGGSMQDTKTDGSCVYLYVHLASGAWSYTGARECNEVQTFFSLGGYPGFTGVRIYRFSSQGNNYLTIWGS